MRKKNLESKEKDKDLYERVENKWGPQSMKGIKIHIYICMYIFECWCSSSVTTRRKKALLSIYNLSFFFVLFVLWLGWF